MLLIALTLFAQNAPASSPVLGVEVSENPSAFIDLARRTREFARLDGSGLAPVDSNGWPKTDFQTVLMDDRPAMAWAPPIDDPAQIQPDESGTYQVEFKGQAQLEVTGGSSVQLGKFQFDPSTGLTTGSFVLPKGAPNLVVLNFRSTHRTANTTESNGITALRVIRPGFTLADKRPFHPAFLKALQPFSYLRCMGWMDTNFQAGYYGDKGHHAIRWEDRSLPNDAIWGQQGLRPGTHGYPWELAIELANETNKDLWINIPISATGSDPNDTKGYVYQLAHLLKFGDPAHGVPALKPGLNIYLEHSNEVWNFGFSQYIWNKLAAEEEVKKGGSVLNKDGSTDHEQWARRRHGVRLYEIAKTFESVFGPGSLNHRVRPIYAAWTIQPDWYQEVLGWMASNFGAPKGYFYALAETGYFNDQRAAKNASPAHVLDAMRADSLEGVGFTRKLKAIANQFGLKLAAYEAGPDNGGGNPTNIGNRILANRRPEMGKLVEEHFRARLFGEGCDLATYFTLASGFSRYGCWGATEDYRDLSSPKYQAVLRLVNSSLRQNSPNHDSGRTTLTPPQALNLEIASGRLTLTWQAVPGATYTVWKTTGGNFVIAKDHLTEAKYKEVLPGNRQAVTYYVTATVGRQTSQPSAQVQAKD